MITENQKINRKLAFKVYGRKTILLDKCHADIFYLYIYDDTAIQTDRFSSTANLLGGEWTVGLNTKGELTKVYAKLCPLWSTDLNKAWNLLQYCLNKKKLKVDVRDYLQHTFLLNKVNAAKEISLFILNNVKG